MVEKMTVGKARELLGQGFHCSQVVFGYAAEKLGADKELALKISGGLGGGCNHGDVCGTVSGAIAGLGLVYGFSKPNSVKQNEILIAKVREFEKRFEEIHGTIKCRELLGGYDFADPKQAAEIMGAGLDGIIKNCPKYCADACAILDDLLEDVAK